MIAWLGASLALVAAISIGCGKYGPPVRVEREAESPASAEVVAPADRGDRSEEDADRKERQP